MNLPTLPLRALPLLGLLPCAFAQGLVFVAPPGETVLDTDSTQVVTTSGPVTVTGGVFVFSSVTIPAGATVRGRGSRPMIWVVDTMTVDGHLSADGQNGTGVQTLASAAFPAPGGQAGPAGGAGGSGSPQIALQSLAGRSGNGPGNSPGLGGSGGLIAFAAACGRGSGGGGGGFATAGDPWFKSGAGAGTSFVQRAGVGGFGCTGVSGSAARALTGGGPGGVPFLDVRPDNDFFGLGYDVASQTFVPGELQGLPGLIGGAGGGGGGDLSNDGLLLSPNWRSDEVGGGGGGGGGCLVVFALQTIVVGPTGRITANGGHGGGGSPAASCWFAGGGGGGAGGLLILAARTHIELHVKGETYANSDYDFVLAADGGVTTTGTFGVPVVIAKYPASGQPTIPGNLYDSAPLGGFGGMGVVQLMTPPGTTNPDGTNTILDDNIRIVRNGVLQAGAQKRRFLAWRGYVNAGGVQVDDFGVPTNVQGNEGDIRPAPALLPLF